MDEREFESVVRATEARIRAHIAGLGVALDEVDDLAQEVYLIFYRRTESAPQGADRLRWLRGVARNVCLDHFRREKRRANRERTALALLLTHARGVFSSTTPAGSYELALEGCLGKLPDSDRRLIEMRYERQLSAQDIGEGLGRNSDAVRARLCRVRTVLRDCILNALGQGT